MQAIRIVLAVAAVTGLAACTAIILDGTEASPAVSGDAASRVAWPAAIPEHPGRPADTSPAQALAAASSRLRIRTITTRDFDLAPQRSDRFFMSCPSGWKAINGYFGADSAGLVLGTSDPERNGSRWGFGLLNINDTTTVRYFTGIICARNFTN